MTTKKDGAKIVDISQHFGSDPRIDNFYSALKKVAHERGRANRLPIASIIGCLELLKQEIIKEEM